MEKNSTENESKKTIELPNVVSVRLLSQLTGKEPSEIIQILFNNGVPVTINESIDFDTAVLICDEIGINAKKQTLMQEEVSKKGKNQKHRPPVVTVMGHVDHGKTLLLDAIRNTNLISKESGGITQHIGAYQINTKYEGKNRSVTFLDTPGHEAFSALRAHGASITDIVVLVVAANEGVKTQTLEAISHARAAQVPIIIAINKIDLPDSDPEKVKRQLSEKGLLAEDWGGDIPTIEVSAKTGKNIDELLDIILLVADMNILTADYDEKANGTVIESHMGVGVGPIGTVLVEEGILKVGQFIVVGKTYGKIRFIKDWKGNKIKEATPSMPVKISGIKSMPQFGDHFRVVDSEKEAKSTLEKSGSEGVVRSIAKNQIKNKFNLIIKADVMGSLESLKNATEDISNLEVDINILSSGIGNINESDVNLAKSSKALIYSFRVGCDQTVQNLANQYKIPVKKFDTIYELIDDLKLTIEGKILPEFSEEETGELYIIKVFFQSDDSLVIGGKVEQGKIFKKIKAYLMNKDEKEYIGFVSSVKIGPTEVEKVSKGDECGVKITRIEGSKNLKIRDKDNIKFFEIHKKITKLT